MTRSNRLVAAVFAIAVDLDLDCQGGRRLLWLYAAISRCEALHWEDPHQPPPL